MTYSLTFTKKQNFLHVKVTGENSVANVRGYLEEVLQKCKDTNCKVLLIEEQLDGPRVNTSGVFKIASEGSLRFRGFYEAIAYVDLNAEGDSMLFAETVASNRGWPLKVFSTVAEAEKWLMERN